MSFYVLKVFRGLVQIGVDQSLLAQNDSEARKECFAFASEFGRQIFDDLMFIPDWRLELHSHDGLIFKIRASVEIESEALSPFSGAITKGLLQAR